MKCRPTLAAQLRNGFAALTVLLGVNVFAFSVRSFLLVNVGLIGLWFVASVLVARAHRALVADARILILDEPTAVLAPIEVDGLLATLRALVEGGASVVMVTHKLDEVRAVADEVTVLRAGAVVATFARGVSTAEIAHAMIGTSMAPPPKAAPVAADAPVALAIEGLTATRRDGGAVRDVSLTVRGGEVYYDGAPVDLAYRDYAVCDLIDLERSGVDVEPMRALFRQNRIISSIAAEL